jgi:alpha-L-fucosidase 2
MTTPMKSKTRGRREFIATAGLAAAFPGLARAQVLTTEREGRKDLSLWYDQPAGPWVEALPVGNARLGAMVFGRPAQERVQLNIDTLYGGGPYVQDNPKFREALPPVRKLIEQERWTEANELVSEALMGRPIKQMPFSSAGDLLIDFPGVTGAARYHRSLDLDSATTTTTFIDGRGRHRREVFCSVPDQVAVIRLEIEGEGTIDLDLAYRPADYKGSGDPRQGPNGVEFAGARWDHREPERADPRPGTLSVRPDGSDALLVEGRNVEAYGIKGVLRYALRVQAVGACAVPAGSHSLSPAKPAM